MVLLKDVRHAFCLLFVAIRDLRPLIPPAGYKVLEITCSIWKISHLGTCHVHWRPMLNNAF